MTLWSDEWDDLLGFKGPRVNIGRYCTFIHPEKIRLVKSVRVDPYFLATCGIEAKGYNHLCAHSVVNGGAHGLVTLGEWAFIGWGSRVFTASDDYSGTHGPHGPFGKNMMHRGDVVFEDFSGVASGSTVMPGCHFKEGAILGAQSYAPKGMVLEPWSIYVGTPAKFLRYRSEKKCKEMAQSEDFLW